MVQGGSEAGFAFKALEVGFFYRKLGGQNFDDNGAAQFVVGGFINRALSAGTDLLRDFVIAESLPDHLRGRI